MTHRIFILLLLAVHSVCAAQSQSSPAALNLSSTASASRPAYTLSPERVATAIAYARARHWLAAIRFAYSIALLLLLLRFRVAPLFRDWAERTASECFLQALIFVPVFQWSFDALSLPGNLAGHWIQRRYGQSIQGWGSWAWDQITGSLVSVAAEVFLVWLLYAVIRCSARRWWFYAWLGALPILIFSLIANPLIIDPLFSRFTPLAASHPELAQQMERVAARASQQIPQSEMYLMDASRRGNQINAYLTGLGAGRRVVVWDTAVARLTTPELLFVFGHEMGHYVLSHITLDLAFSAGLLLVAFWLGFHGVCWTVRRYGNRWGLGGVADWASLPALFLFFSLLGFAATPASNAFARYLERQADQYALEVVHGIVPDASATAASSFQIVGEASLEEQSPSWLIKVWFYNHPPLAERIQFASAYNPWAAGQLPRFVK